MCVYFRAHLNDLENIPIFLISGLLFVITKPNVIFALMMFRIYTLARIVYTIVYAIYVVRQPVRSGAFFIGLLVNVIMVITVLITFTQF